MENLVVINNGQPVTNSLLVAEKFGKQHKDVLEAIRKLTSAEFSADLSQMFASVELPDTYGRLQPVYIMNRDGFSLLVMGFTGEKALRFKLDYIEAFNKMEVHIKSNSQTIDFSNPDTVLVLVQNWKEEREKVLLLEAQVQEQAPAVVFRDAVVGSTNSCLIGELAKLLRQNGVNIGQNRLFEWLRQNGYLCSKGERYNMPTQYAMDMGLLDIKEGVRTGNNGVLHTTLTPKVTGKGQEYFINKFLKKAA